MADFDAVLRKTIEGLADPTPELRQKVYQRARSTVEAKLAAINPPPPAAAVERQRKALDDAIGRIEAEFTPAAPSDTGPDELESIFASLANPTQAPAKRDGPTPAPKVPESFAAKSAEPQKPQPVPSALAPKPEDENAGGEPDGITSKLALRPVGPEDGEDLDIDDLPRSDGRRSLARERRSGGLVRLALAAAVLIILAGGGYAVWLNKDAFSTLFAGLVSEPQQAEPEPTEAGADTAADLEEEPAAPEEEQQAAAAIEEGATPAQPSAAAEPESASPPAPPKFTQRLLADGSEVDEGPAGEAPGLGEGTSVAELTEQATAEQAAPQDEATPQEPTAAEEPAPQAPADPQPVQAGVPVGQRAIFYEERTSSAQGSAEPGSIVWTVVQESPGGDLPPEPAIRAEATIPGKELQLRMTIRRNGDRSLPASHIIEMIFLAPDDFAGGGIDNVLRMTMKESEQATGNPLIGIPAKIADGFFLIALSDGTAESEANLTLLRRENWIDIPMVYRSGRRALITMEKGVPGERVFEEVMRAWDNASSG